MTPEHEAALGVMLAYIDGQGSFEAALAAIRRLARTEPGEVGHEVEEGSVLGIDESWLVGGRRERYEQLLVALGESYPDTA